MKDHSHWGDGPKSYKCLPCLQTAAVTKKRKPLPRGLKRGENDLK